MNGKTNRPKPQHDVAPSGYCPTAIRLLEQYQNGIVDAIERCKGLSSVTRDDHMITESEFAELSKRLKNVSAEIWYLKNI